MRNPNPEQIKLILKRFFFSEPTTITITAARDVSISHLIFFGSFTFKFIQSCFLNYFFPQYTPCSIILPLISFDFYFSFLYISHLWFFCTSASWVIVTICFWRRFKKSDTSTKKWIGYRFKRNWRGNVTYDCNYTRKLYAFFFSFFFSFFSVFCVFVLLCFCVFLLLRFSARIYIINCNSKNFKKLSAEMKFLNFFLNSIFPFQNEGKTALHKASKNIIINKYYT